MERKRAAPQYGVHLNIHPSILQKYVMLHALPCGHFRQHGPKRKGIYTFNKNCRTFREAVERMSRWAIEWHAPIKVCSTCQKKGRLPIP